VLATLIDAYEAEHYPMDPPDPIEAMSGERVVGVIGSNESTDYFIAAPRPEAL
jgi:hypothetical protein